MADYLAPFPGLSFGNLHGTLVHLVGAEMNWHRRWTGQGGGVFTAAEYPDLASLRNLNHPADYQAALAEAGFPPVSLPPSYGLPQ